MLSTAFFFLDGFDLNGYTLQNVLVLLYTILQGIVLTKFLDCGQTAEEVTDKYD